MVPAPDLARLIAELSSDDALRRETAVARLALAGARAVPHLTALASDQTAPPAARVAAFGALEASAASAHAVAAAAAGAAAEAEEVAVAAIDCLARAAHGGGSAATAAFDRLAAIALDSTEGVSRRLAALGGLDGLPDRHVKPVFEALRADPASRVVARVLRRQAGLLLPLEDLIERGIPDDPALVAALVRDDADDTRVTALRRLVDLVRDRERHRPDETRARWMAVRGQVHQHLASRSSRIALYDLRDALERMRGPIPVGFLAAAATIGDASCLEPIAAAWLKTPPEERWWRDHLEDAFGAIVKREGISRRHPRLRALLTKAPAAAPLVALARKR
jgi:hypothetical protein